MARRDVIPGGRAGKAMVAGTGVSFQDDAKKTHRTARSGPSAERKKEKDKKKRGVSDGERENPRVSTAFRRTRTFTVVEKASTCGIMHVMVR